MRFGAWSPIVIIIAGILLGVFTAVEAGAVACIWAFCVTMFVYRDLAWRDLPGSRASHAQDGLDGDDANRDGVRHFLIARKTHRDQLSAASAS